MNCPWCEQPNMLGMNGFCSEECQELAGKDYDKYINWYNDYMAGFDVPSFEKITARPKRKFDRDGKREDQ